MDAIEIIVVRS